MNKGFALITGASSGIGKELSLVMAREGHSLVLIARRSALLDQLKEEILEKYQVRVETISSDLAVRTAPEEIMAELRKLGITPHILINNAGFGLTGHFSKTDLHRETMMIDVNITALVKLSKLLLPGMLKQGHGHIMNLASTAAFQPGPLMAVYYASKAFVLSFSEALAEELSGTGITVTALCPGPTESEFGEVSDMQESRLFKDRRIPHASEVAEYGYKAMISGDRVAIHGISNKFLAFATRFTPRGLATKVVRYLQEKKHK